MVTIHKDHLSSVLLMETYSEMHQIKEKIAYFEKKYGQNFMNFKKQAFSKEEDFDIYDDYIEWKGYENKRKEIEQTIKDLNRGKF
jgi:hypothetical protein